MTRFRTWINSREEVSEGEYNSLPSITQPNEAMSVRDIIEQYAKGIPVSQSQDGFYDTDEGDDFSDFDKMDYFDKRAYIEENKEYIASLQARVDANNSFAKDSQPQAPEPDSTAKQEE